MDFKESYELTQKNPCEVSREYKAVCSPAPSENQPQVHPLQTLKKDPRVKAWQGVGQRENTFTAIAKTGKGELARGAGGGSNTATFTYTRFLRHPFPKPTVSLLSLWPRLCSNIKMGSDKRSMWCRHLGNSGYFFSYI